VSSERLRELESLIISYKAFAESDDGVAILKDLSRECYEKELTFVDGNPNGTAFNEGKRYVMLHIRRFINTNVDDVRELSKKLER